MLFKKKKPETSYGWAGDMDYRLVRTSRRSMSLQIKEGELVVRAPHRTPLREIEDWIYQKRKWILRHQAKSRTRQENEPGYGDGEAHPFLGEIYRLRISKGPKAAVDLVGGEFRVTLRGEVTEAKIEKALRTFYTDEAERFFEDRLSDLFPPFAARGHKGPPITVRWMKSRWGSMSTTGKMTLNTQLIKKDVALIDYVIIHELCHMEHMNHGKGFYKLMDQMLPGWKPLRKELKGEL